jgi:hypothetical protein
MNVLKPKTQIADMYVPYCSYRTKEDDIVSGYRIQIRFRMDPH